MEYSPFSLDIETSGVLNACRELGVTVVAYSPLGRGFLTGRYKSPEDFEEGDFRRLSVFFLSGGICPEMVINWFAGLPPQRSEIPRRKLRQEHQACSQIRRACQKEECYIWSTLPSLAHVPRRYVIVIEAEYAIIDWLSLQTISFRFLVQSPPSERCLHSCSCSC